MNHPASPRKNLHPTLSATCAGLLLVCGVNASALGNTPVRGTNEAATVDAPTAACVASPAPVHGRHKYYTQDELAAAASDFTKHIKVLVGSSNVDVDSPVLRIPWSSIKHVQDSISKGKLVQGIYINHGLNGTKYHPVLEFMYPSNDMGDLQVFADAWFSFDPATKSLVPESDPKKYMDAYLNTIRVDRTGSGFSALRPDGSDPDPLAIWFPYADNVSQLLAQNPSTDTYLVVSSISEPRGTRAIYDATASAEFRHLLALHIADGSRDLLSNTFDVYLPFQDKAMDLGNMCPPHCPKKTK